MKKRLAQLPASSFFVLLTAVSASADQMIYGLASGSVCRDAAGKIIAPPIKITVSATKAVAVELGHFDLVKLKSNVEGRECYFFRAEVNLKPTPSPCSAASVGGPNFKIPGTRGDLSCTDK
jgi:hypothetical protein